MSPSCFPPTVLSLDAALPSTGSFRSSSPASPVLSGATTSCRPSRRTPFSFAWRYHGNTRSFAPGAAECCDVGPGVDYPVSPAGISSMETTGSPTFLGNPMCLCPALRPRQDRRVRPLRHADAAPALTTTKAPALQLSRLNHTASALAVYASQHGLPHDHARLASGRRPGSTGRAFHPQGSCKRFQTHLMFAILLFQAFVAQGQALFFVVRSTDTVVTRRNPALHFTKKQSSSPVRGTASILFGPIVAQANRIDKMAEEGEEVNVVGRTEGRQLPSLPRSAQR